MIALTWSSAIDLAGALASLLLLIVLLAVIRILFRASKQDTKHFRVGMYIDRNGKDEEE